jgi:hypothetical protein
MEGINKMEYDRLIIKKPDDANEIDRDRMVKISQNGGRIVLGKWMALETRARGEFADHAIFLPPVYDWVLGKDREGTLCLVPLKRKSEK